MAPNKPITGEQDRNKSGRHLRLVHVNADTQPDDPELEAEAAFFRRCGLSKPAVRLAMAAARNNATTIETELLSAGKIDPQVHYRWLADCLGLAYFEKIDPHTIVPVPSPDVLLRRKGPLRLIHGNEILTVIVPSVRTITTERKLLAFNPALGQRMAVAAPQTIRNAIWKAGEQERIRETTGALQASHPQSSAKHVLTGLQGYLFAACQACGLLTAILWPSAFTLALHIFLSVFFLLSNAMRVAAAIFGHRPNRPQLPRALPAQLPVYTILVALKDEPAMAEQLVRGLDRLIWPKSLLDIKLVCEADDPATAEALKAVGLGPQYEIVEVPKYGPQTKPKALEYALAGARGKFVTIYDAEDVPAPLQLLEAWTLFEAGDEMLACIQSPLAIANYRRNWLTALFAIEYGGLFRGMVPFLDRFGLPIPLGGTSNHFRKDALLKVGGWDPYNVTEDADLGLRLYRAGYRTKAAFHATIEVAPDNLHDWLNQRSRWLKGWAQTWLILMRQPFQVNRELGTAGFLTTQILIAGMLVSTLAHPAMYIFIAIFTLAAITGQTVAADPVHYVLFGIDILNIIGSYVSFGLLGLRHMTRTERTGIKKRHLLLLPVYWLAMSRSGWNAIGELADKAHYWAKTPHPGHRQ